MGMQLYTLRVPVPKAPFESDDARPRGLVDKCIAASLALKQKYITWLWLAGFTQRRFFKKLAERLNIISQQIRKAGRGFAHHNRVFEFIDHNGQNGYDISCSSNSLAAS
jgi:hypothetical protein